jgi:hypothetical protein
MAFLMMRTTNFKTGTTALPLRSAGERRASTTFKIRWHFPSVLEEITRMTKARRNTLWFACLALLALPPSCGGGSGSSGQTPPPQTPNYSADITATANWTVSSSSSLPDGAILDNSTEIEPYFGNLAAIGLTKNAMYYPQVQAWMQWYVNHLNSSDVWGLSCTVYDYSVSGTTETSTNDADSTDSYAATFASLAWAYWQTGDANAQAYIKTLQPQLECIANVMLQTQQSNGLTWAKPDYQTQYLMDNSEVYKGLTDLAGLFQVAYNDTTDSAVYTTAATNVSNGIQTYLWDSAHNDYLTSVGAPTTNWQTWYPDSTAQLYPIVNGVISPTSTNAMQLYSTFNTNWPNWTSANNPDSFPWAVISGVAALMGDTTRVNSYITAIQTKYVNGTPAFQSPWYCAESGWFIRVNNYMLGGSPL